MEQKYLYETENKKENKMSFEKCVKLGGLLKLLDSHYIKVYSTQKMNKNNT